MPSAAINIDYNFSGVIVQGTVNYNRFCNRDVFRLDHAPALSQILQMVANLALVVVGVGFAVYPVGEVGLPDAKEPYWSSMTPW